MKRWWLLTVLGVLACRGDDADDTPPQVTVAAPPVVAVAPPAPPPVKTPPVELAPKPAPWTFVALSDLHIPNQGESPAIVKRLVGALVGLKPRAVVITGDFTNGTTLGGVNKRWWTAVAAALEPLREAKIPVLPVAGNHDSYGWAQKTAYAEAFGDLTAWAGGLEIHSQPQKKGELSTARVPFSYSVDIEGVHFALAHVVTQFLEPGVAAWLKEDLDGAAKAKARLVFGHVPMASVIRPPSKRFGEQFGPILEAGHADFTISGHEHVVWDEDVPLPHGKIHQVLVGCSSGYYNYQPTKVEQTRAACEPKTKAKALPLRCKMPNTGGEFELEWSRRGRLIQHFKNSFTLFTVDGDKITVTPMTVDTDGKAQPFYLPPR